MALDLNALGYSDYRDYLEQTKYNTGSTTEKTDGTSSTQKTQKWDAVFEEDNKGSLDVNGFMKIMVAQLTNQDFMNPVDDTQFVTQMAQFSMMQQMSDMTSNMKNNYMLSLAGKTVTCAKFNVSGNVVKETGKVERIILAEDDYSIYVNGEKFSLSQIMEIGEGSQTNAPADTPDPDPSDETEGEGTETDKTETDGTQTE